MKYHEESKNVSMVSVSRRAAPPHLGQVVLIHSGTLSSGFPSPPNFAFSGSLIGSSATGTGWTPHVSQ